MSRHERASTIVTTNRPIEDWGKVLGDAAAAGAILDRFLYHAEMITTPGPSYRLHDRKGKGLEIPEIKVLIITKSQVGRFSGADSWPVLSAE